MINRIIEFIQDWWDGRPELGARNSGWSKLRDKVVAEHPFCAMCKSEKRLQAHHILTVAIFKEFEMDKNNIMVLCYHCHFKFAHLGSYRSYNKDIKKDSDYIRHKIENRP